MGTGMYIFFGFLTLFGIVGLFNLLTKIGNDNKKELLDEMFENDDISATVYKKYKK